MDDDIIRQFDLKRALDNYVPYDDIDREHHKQIVQFVDNCDNVFDRRNMYGHVTGSAYLFNADLSKVLLTHHKKIDRWVQLGGHSDNDCNTMRVAFKEAREESGIHDIHLLMDSIFDVEVHQFENRLYQEQSHKHFDIRFALYTNSNNYVVSSESVDIGWFDKFQLSEGRIKFELGARFVAKWDRLVSLLRPDYSVFK
ncbi:MAG: hypothetical protein LBK70_01705 [Clostridiales bacterium]|nr:hypothetical protein [Clostridiales bacterium]